MRAWVYLAGAIAAELLGTSCLKASEGMTRLWPAVGVVVGYAAAFALMALSLKSLPVGVVYAVWSGVGIIGISLIGLLYFQDRLSPAAWTGIALIVLGVIVVSIAAPPAR